MSIIEIIYIVAIVFITTDIIKEIINIRSIKSRFTCNHCNTFHSEISQIDKCKNCHRTFNLKAETWEHFILHRVNRFPSNRKSDIHKFKDYRKLSIIEIAIDIGFISILLSNIIIN